MQRGEILRRFDVKYFALRESLSNIRYSLQALGSLLIEEPDYGSGARAVQRTRSDQPRYIRITDFGEDGIEPGHEYLTADPVEMDCQLVFNDILFARSGATVGKTYLHEDVSEPAVFAGYCIRFRCQPSKALPRFIYWFTKTDAYWRWVATIQRPAGQPNINKEEFKSLEIPLPLPDKQQELVTAMDAARAARRAKRTEADALLTGLDSFLLDTLDIIPPPKDDRKVFSVHRAAIVTAGRCDPGYHHPRYDKIMAAFAACPFPKVTLGQLSPDIVGGATPTKGSTDLYATGGIKFLRILNVKANEFDLSDLNHIKLQVHEGELKRSQLAENDVLMTITGRVGNAAVVTADMLPANINQHIVRLRLTTDEVLPEYLAIYLNSSAGLALSNRGVTGGTRVALDYGAIRAIAIPVPSRDVQDRIVAEANHLREEARRLRAEADTGWQTAKRRFEEELLGGDH